MESVELNGCAVNMVELTDGWTIVKSEAEYRLWKLTRAPLEEVKACVDKCYEDHVRERKAQEHIEEIINTQYCPECGRGFDRALRKCPYCEKIATEMARKAQAREQRAENVARFVTTGQKVVQVGNGVLRFISTLLGIVFFPVALVAIFLNACMKAQRRSERSNWPHKRRRY